MYSGCICRTHTFAIASLEVRRACHSPLNRRHGGSASETGESHFAARTHALRCHVAADRKQSDHNRQQTTHFASSSETLPCKMTDWTLSTPSTHYPAATICKISVIILEFPAATRDGCTQFVSMEAFQKCMWDRMLRMRPNPCSHEYAFVETLSANAPAVGPSRSPELCDLLLRHVARRQLLPLHFHSCSGCLSWFAVVCMCLRQCNARYAHSNTPAAISPRSCTRPSP